MSVDIAVDPGISGAGYVLMNKDMSYKFIVKAGVLNADNSLSWEEKAVDIAEQLFAVAKSYGGCRNMYCEFPIIYNNPGGISIAVKGDILKLIYSVGVLAGVFKDSLFKAIKVNIWKGQLPKKAVEKRIIQKLGAKTCTRLGLDSHSWDAVGIALYVRGDF